jgi:hypothetical protein
MMKSRKIRWAGRTVTHGGYENSYRRFVGKCEEADYLEGQDVDGTIILRWMLEKYNWREWTGYIWQRIVVSGGFLTQQ